MSIFPCHKIFPLLLSLKLTQFTRKPFRISSVFDGIFLKLNVVELDLDGYQGSYCEGEFKTVSRIIFEKYTSMNSYCNITETTYQICILFLFRYKGLTNKNFLSTYHIKSEIIWCFYHDDN